MLASATHDFAGQGIPPSRSSRPPAANSSQLDRLNRLLHRIWRHDPFYRCKWRCSGLTPRELHCVDALADFPFTTRAELVADQTRYSPLGTNLTCSPAHIKHIHRSSGTTHAPLFWGDTPESWDWVTRASQALFELAGVTATDRVLILLPFGASSGPWIIRAGAQRLGCCTFTADPSDPDLECILRRLCPTVVVTKLAHWSADSPSALPVSPRLVLTSSNPIHPSTVETFSRYGLTEAGSVAGECAAHNGMHLLGDNFIAEVIHPINAAPVDDGSPGELVLTTLGRIAQPIIRYRTGDIVRLVRRHTCPCGRIGTLLIGGVRRAVGLSGVG